MGWLRRWLPMAIPIALVILVAAVWLRSHSRTHWIRFGDVPLLDHAVGVWSTEGRACVYIAPAAKRSWWSGYRITHHLHWPFVDTDAYETSIAYHTIVRWPGLGIFEPLGRKGTFGSDGLLIVDYWLVLAIIAVLPVYLVTRDQVVSRVRLRRGRCRTCAYDLRGMPDDTCPECGQPVRRKSHGNEGRAEHA